MKGALLALCVLILVGCAPLTAEKLLTNPQQYEGKQITITASPELSPVRCTKMACPAENACCNLCGATLLVKTSKGDIQIEGPTCRGNECQLNCTITAYRETALTGQFRNTEDGYILDVSPSS
ncbi:MAG: hypothetical protein Q7S65_03975 [Nanoarchaeota archaeon]|nr:hypothetical protein [Nanoarchaeota archaeon]